MMGKAGTRKLGRGVEVIYEDEALIVIDKPAGLLAVGTEKDKERTAHYVLTDYVRKGNWKSRKRVFVVHRLDQWTSGVMVFAKSEEVKERLQEGWKDVEKKYAAVVWGRPAEKEGVVRSYLAENKAYVVYSTKDAKKGKLAETAYKVVREGKRFSMAEVRLLTGRKNQIRVHFADMGHPIAGDRKYGREGDGCERLMLHAKEIAFRHPVSGEWMRFESKVPGCLRRLVED